MSEVELRTLTGRGGHKMWLRQVVPEAPRAGVLVVHGYSGHSGRYTHLLEALGEAGFAALCPDHRGHGLSARMLGLIEEMDDIVADLAAIRLEMDAMLGGAPAFILGHSMGGLLSVLLLSQQQAAFRGAVLSAPALVSPDAVSPPMKALAHALSRRLPSIGVRGYFDPAKAARSEKARRSMIEDPLFYKGKVRARTASQILKGVDKAYAAVESLTLPLLVLHGERDRVVPLAASHAVMARAPSQDKTLHILPGSYHQLLDDPEWEEVLALTTRWMKDRA